MSGDTRTRYALALLAAVKCAQEYAAALTEQASSEADAGERGRISGDRMHALMDADRLLAWAKPLGLTRLRVRFLGSGPQWGNGGPYHGWQVWREFEDRWRTPRDAYEHAAIGAVMALDLPSSRIAPPSHGILATIADSEVVLDLEHQGPGWS